MRFKLSLLLNIFFDNIPGHTPKVGGPKEIT
jgi:hypothetical protein